MLPLLDLLGSTFPGLKPPIDKHWGWWLLWLLWTAFWVAFFGLIAWVLVDQLI